MPERTRHGGWKILALGAALSFIVPLLLSLGPVAAGLPQVMDSGMCPAAPTDIPPYPCTPREYLLRMTLGPWAMMGHVVIWTAWCVVLFVVGLIVVVARRIPRRLEERRP